MNSTVRGMILEGSKRVLFLAAFQKPSCKGVVELMRFIQRPLMTQFNHITYRATVKTKINGSVLIYFDKILIRNIVFISDSAGLPLIISPSRFPEATLEFWVVLMLSRNCPPMNEVWNSMAS
jgi:hypothetical protein